jgi:hypothetical protein
MLGAGGTLTTPLNVTVPEIANDKSAVKPLGETGCTDTTTASSVLSHRKLIGEAVPDAINTGVLDP